MKARTLRAYAEVALGRQRSPEHAEGPHMVPYLRAANVKDGVLDLTDVKEMNFTPQEQMVFALRHGDVLVTEGAGSLAAVGAAAVWSGQLPGRLCFQNTLLRLRPRPGVSGRFLAWWARHAYANGEFASVATGVNIYHLSAERVRSLPARFPDEVAQDRIADYLDGETARIDVLITKKRRLLELVEESWSSRLCQSFGGSDSWVPLKSVARFREGPGILAVDFRDEGTPLLRIGNLVEDTISLEGCGFLDPADVAIRWRHLVVHAGELIVSGSATSGLPVVVPPEAEGAVPYTGLIRIWPSVAALDRDYLRFFLASRLFSDQMDQLKTGIGLQHWGPSHLSQVRMPCPTLVQQRVVVESLIRLRNIMRKAQVALQAQSDLLVEHRQALVTAAVRGELSIPGVAA